MQKALGAAKGQKAYLSMSQNTFTLSYESRPKKAQVKIFHGNPCDGLLGDSIRPV
jgi:hypothetical protein